MKLNLEETNPPLLAREWRPEFKALAVRLPNKLAHLTPVCLAWCVHAWAFSLLLTSVVVSAGTPDEISASVDHDRGQIEWSYKGKKLLVYVFGSNQFKPYVKSLYTFEGEDVLRDAPADHVHHHALMYAVHVNGINFWEERDQPGYQRPVKLLAHRTGRTATGLPQASFTQLIHWVREADRDLTDTGPAALLIERRTITVTVDEARTEIGLRWQAEFEAGPAAERVKLDGSNYNGLGLRLPAAWNKVARHWNSENGPYATEQLSHLTPARWAAVSNEVNERDITVALFGHPENRGKPRFFSRLNKFAYLAVTQSLSETPIEYSRSEKFSIDYLLLVYSGHPTVAQLDDRYARWLKESALSAAAGGTRSLQP